MNTIDQEFVMQVWSGCIARRAKSANDLALFDVLAPLHGAFVEMQVLGGVSLTMLDKHVVAVGFTVCGCDDLALTRGKDRCASGCRIVNAAVRANALVNGVHPAQVEIGADSCEIEGCA